MTDVYGPVQINRR